MPSPFFILDELASLKTAPAQAAALTQTSWLVIGNCLNYSPGSAFEGQDQNPASDHRNTCPFAQ